MTETIIELKNLSIGYGNKSVLQDVNAKINKGDRLSVLLVVMALVKAHC